jgi:endonuclease-3
MSRASCIKRDKITQVLSRLEQAYGPRPWASRGKCLDVLVAYMLAQNTLLENAQSGYRQLRRAFRSWTQVMGADVDAVQRSIAICGLARMRARRLQAMLRKIKAERGALDLEFLKDRPADEAYDYLMGFYGIGPKTAACTLLFAFGTPRFPVDNGIHRVLRRLRLVRPKGGHEEAQRIIERAADANQLYPLHVLTFHHGKKLCRPKNPKCDQCPLIDLCPHGKRRLKHTAEPELPKRARKVILSGYASAGIPKHAVREEE